MQTRRAVANGVSGGQHLPPTGPVREELRRKGQFWTPDWVADAMTAYALSSGGHEVFDPAVGEGAFFRAAKRVGAVVGRSVSLYGTDVDPSVVSRPGLDGLAATQLGTVEIRDFILDPPAQLHRAIVANPPYIRHHRLSQDTKAQARRMAARTIGKALDGRAGLHVFFFLQSLQLLSPGGNLSFIMPADTCEGVYATDLWRWVAEHFALDAVVTFDAQATPFAGVDTNPVVVMVRRGPASGSVAWVRVHRGGSSDLLEWVLAGRPWSAGPAISVARRHPREMLATGLSRPPRTCEASNSVLGDYVRVMRGIATGDNRYFLLTSRHARELGLPDEWLRPAVARTRDVPGDTIGPSLLDALEQKGRPTRLLYLDGRPPARFPEAVQRYIEYGERLGVPSRALISQRRPWFRMETREVPPFLFAYLGRRNARFVRNDGGALPLTGFLCLYPRSRSPEQMEGLWTVLRHPQVIANLSLVGKSYGSGAIKVEPRALERLPLPDDVVADAGLSRACLL